MNRQQKALRIYLPIFLAVMAITVTLRTCALFIDFNTDSIYFDRKILINFASAIAAGGSLLLFTYAFVSDKKIALIASFHTPATYIPTTLISVALLFYVFGALSEIRSMGITFSEALVTKNIIYILLCVLAILAFLCIGYFLLNAFVASRASLQRAAFGIIAVIFFAVYSSFLYFNTELPINSPNKTVDQMAFLFCALFFLYEIRISLGRECWNLYIAFGFIAATLTAYSSVPSLIYYFVSGNVISDTIYETALSLCVAIFITSRILLAYTLGEDRMSDTVLLMKEASAGRMAYIAEQEELARLAYLEVYNRMTETSEVATEPSEKELFPPITDDADEGVGTQVAHSGETEQGYSAGGAVQTAGADTDSAAQTDDIGQPEGGAEAPAQQDSDTASGIGAQDTNEDTDSEDAISCDGVSPGDVTNGQTDPGCEENP